MGFCLRWLQNCVFCISSMSICAVSFCSHFKTKQPGKQNLCVLHQVNRRGLVRVPLKMGNGHVRALFHSLWVTEGIACGWSPSCNLRTCILQSETVADFFCHSGLPDWACFIWCSAGAFFFSPAMQQWLGTALTLTMSIQAKMKQGGWHGRPGASQTCQNPHVPPPLLHKLLFLFLRRYQTCNFLGSFFQCFWQHRNLMDKNSFSRVFSSLSPIVRMREAWNHGGSVAALFFFLCSLSLPHGPEKGTFPHLVSLFSLLHWPLSWRDWLLCHLVFFVPGPSARLSTFVSSGYCCYFGCCCFTS